MFLYLILVKKSLVISCKKSTQKRLKDSNRHYLKKLSNLRLSVCIERERERERERESNM